MTLKFNLKTTALICIDLQAGVFTKEGTLALVGTDEILPKVKQVLAAARGAKIPIIIDFLPGLATEINCKFPLKNFALPSC